MLSSKLRKYREAAETSVSLALGNIFDFLSMSVITIGQEILVTYRGLLLVYPQISALSGGLLLSSTGRLISHYLIGSLDRSKIVREAASVLGPGVVLVLVFSILAGAVGGFEIISLAAASSAFFVLSAVVSLAVAGILIYITVRLRLSPDYTVPAVLTSFVDLVVIILAIAVYPILLDVLNPLSWIVIVSVSLSISFMLIALNFRLSLDTIYSNIALQIFETGAGLLLATAAPLLVASGFLAVIPPVNKLAGSVASGTASWATTQFALFGLGKRSINPVGMSARMAAASIPPSIVVGVAGYALAVVGGASYNLYSLLAVVILASGLSFIGSIIAWAIVLVAVRAGVDPDATSQPLVTGLVDLMGVSLFYIASVALVGVV